MSETDELRAEVAELRQAIRGYEHCVAWYTTCRNCADTLDAAYRETVRAEVAEAEVERLTREAPKVQIDRSGTGPATCKIWRGDVLVFDGIDRTVLATGTDARERLRQAEERLAAVEALAVEWSRLRDGVLSPGLRKAVADLAGLGKAIKADNDETDRQDYRQWLSRGEDQRD